LRYLLFIPILGAATLLSAQAVATGVADTLRVIFEPTGGRYPGTQAVKLYAPGASAIYYTVDGSTPTARSQAYQGPILLEETTVLRARAYRGKEAGVRCGQTYLIDEPGTHFMTVSIGVSPDVLFHPGRGIFREGYQVVDSLWHKPGANFWTRREQAIHLDLFAADGSLIHSNLSGMRLFGGMSRLFPQKSLALIARKRYGDSRFSYPIFGEQGPKNFKFLVLRNSGSDFGKSHFRDAFMTHLVKDWDLETQAFQPAHVYLNGHYWGIYNIREKVNRYFIEDHAEDVDRDSIDLLEHYLVRKRGSRRHYQELLDFLARYDLNLDDNYEHVKTYIEVDNFMDYQIAQIYFDNQDAGGNIKYWRPQRPDGRWRWILYDTDWGFGLHQAEAYRHNSLAFHTEPNGPHWPNPPWSTLLLRKLLQNEGFRARMLNRFADHLNVSFREERVTHLLDSFYLLYHQDMPRHLKRWRLSEKRWLEHLDRMREFAQKRPQYLRAYLQDFFAAGEERRLHLQTSPGGQVLLNEHQFLQAGSFRGIYFANYPIQLRAIPNHGYRFVRWEGLPPHLQQQASERQVTLDLQADRPYRIKAIYEPFVHPLTDQLMINEVCAKNPRTGDWLEIHNTSEETVELSGWVLTDLNNEFVFPEVSLLPHDYLIVCRDAARFRKVFPTAYNVIGGLGFGLNKRHEVLGLYSRLGAAVDSFAYELPPMDSAFTLSLLLPSLDNADIENWELRTGNGTPNAPNPYYVESKVRSAQNQWIQMGMALGVLILGIALLIFRARMS